VSFFNPETLVSSSDTIIATINREPETVGTANIGHDTLLEWGLIGKGFRLINNDSTNNLGFRLHSNRGILRVVPVSSELVVQEWFSILIIEPDGTTGDGTLELELTTLKDARRKTGKV